jgi:D-3-phosphoglycerate dehydrogenase
MVKILANDGIHPDGQSMLEKANFQVDTDKISQDDLVTGLQPYEVIIVRSATKVRKDLIDQCPNLKVICRAGVGMDNIDVDYARSKGLKVYNTPSASSRSVAELTIAHILTLARSLHQSNREMPVEGDTNFKGLKKSYSKGREMFGLNLGIIGFGKIGQESARVAMGIGMNVIPVDPYVKSGTIDILPAGREDLKVSVELETKPMDEMLENADVICMHVPFTGKPLIGVKEFAKMKDGVIVVNTARGGVIDEAALLKALETGKVNCAALDVFINEPTPMKALLSHPKISLSPHIGASTGDAQSNVGTELAEQIINFYKGN